MGILNQVGNLGNKPKLNQFSQKFDNLKDYYENEIFEILQDGYFDEGKLKLMKKLGFPQEIIFNHYDEIKKLMELVYNGIGIQFISFKDLKDLIQKYNGDISLIKRELRKKVDLKKYPFNGQSLLLHILYR